jgi:hypothetical protein
MIRNNDPPKMGNNQDIFTVFVNLNSGKKSKKEQIDSK